MFSQDDDSQQRVALFLVFGLVALIVSGRRRWLVHAVIARMRAKPTTRRLMPRLAGFMRGKHPSFGAARQSVRHDQRVRVSRWRVH